MQSGGAWYLSIKFSFIYPSSVAIIVLLKYVFFIDTFEEFIYATLYTEIFSQSFKKSIKYL